MENEPRLMTSNQAATFLNISVRSLYRNGVPHVRIGGRRLYRKELLEDYINNHTVDPCKTDHLTHSTKGTAFSTTTFRRGSREVVDFEAVLAQTRSKKRMQSRSELLTN